MASEGSGPIISLSLGKKKKRDAEVELRGNSKRGFQQPAARDDDVKVIKTLPLIAVLRKAQMARELVEVQLFLFLILFMSLTVYKFLGTAQTRIESNGYFANCISAANGGASIHDLNFYPMNAPAAWESLKQCTNGMIDRGVARSKGTNVGTPVIGDFQRVVMVALIQTHRYYTVPCTAQEALKVTTVDNETQAQVCFGLEGFDGPGQPYGPDGKFKREFLRGYEYENGETVTYNGHRGIWAYVQYVSFGYNQNLTESYAVINGLSDDGWFDEYTYKSYMDVVSYAGGYGDMNYLRITFTRSTPDGGLRSAGMVPQIFAAPINPMIRSWESYGHPLPMVDYDSTTRFLDGFVYQILYGFFLLITWFFTLRDAGLSLVEEWIEQVNRGVTPTEAIGSLGFVTEYDLEPGEEPPGILIRLWHRVLNFVNWWSFLVQNFAYFWTIVDLASNVVMSVNFLFLTVAVVNGNSSNWFHRLPSASDDSSNYLQEAVVEMQYVTVIQYTAAVAMIFASVRIFKSLKDIPGLRVYSLLFYKAYPRLKDFFIFFILIIFFLSIAIFFVFTSTGGNPDFQSLGSSFSSIMAFTFGNYPNAFENDNIGTANNGQIISGVLWLVIILLNVIALNILLAILVDAYGFATDDADLNKEASSMLEPSFLANYISLVYYLLSVPVETVILPFYRKFLDYSRKARVAAETAARQVNKVSQAAASKVGKVAVDTVGSVVGTVGTVGKAVGKGTQLLMKISNSGHSPGAGEDLEAGVSGVPATIHEGAPMLEPKAEVLDVDAERSRAAADWQGHTPASRAHLLQESMAQVEAVAHEPRRRMSEGGESVENDAHLDRDGDGDVDWEDLELSIGRINQVDAELFQNAVAEEDFSNPVVDLRQVIDGFRADQTEFYMRGTRAKVSVLFLKRFLQCDAINRWPKYSRMQVYHPCFEGFGESTVKISNRVYTPGLRFFCLPQYIGFQSLPLLLLEWKLARDPFTGPLLDFFEDATTNTIDDSVVDMTLTEDALLDYFLKSLKAVEQERVVLDAIVHKLFQNPLAILASFITGELLFLLCHGIIFSKLIEAVLWCFGFGRKDEDKEKRREAFANELLSPRAGRRNLAFEPQESTYAGSTVNRSGSDDLHGLSLEGGGRSRHDALSRPTFSYEYDAVEVLTYIKDIMNAFGRPNEQQMSLKENIAKSVTQFARWAKIPLHRMEEDGGRPCGILETSSMQKALNRVSWVIVSRMSRADQLMRETMGQSGPSDATRLENFLEMALRDYLQERGWPEGLISEKKKIVDALSLSAKHLTTALDVEDSARTLRRPKSTHSLYKSQARERSGKSLQNADSIGSKGTALDKMGDLMRKITSHGREGGVRIPSRTNSNANANANERAFRPSRQTPENVPRASSLSRKARADYVDPAELQ